MRRLLSYAKSHIYDIHAVLAATIVVVLMYWIKKPIKKKIVEHVDKLMQQKPELLPRKRLYLKRWNMLLILLTVCLSFVVFTVVEFVSPMIDFSVPTVVMTAVYALCEYAVFEQVTYGRRKKEDRP